MVSSCKRQGGRSGNAGPRQLVDPIGEALYRFAKPGHGPVDDVAHDHVPDGEFTPSVTSVNIGWLRVNVVPEIGRPTDEPLGSHDPGGNARNA